MEQPHTRKITVSTPGRICLFGEHQDYLGLPIIAAAISLRVRLACVARRDRLFRIDLPDVGKRITFELDGRLAYHSARDYFRSGHNVLYDLGVTWEHGWDCQVRGEIPINSGTSSSSALMVSWIKFLLAAAGSDRRDDAEHISRLAYRAEVQEFNEPGGMMDHFSTCYGDVIYLDFPGNTVRRLQPALGAFVLGDSRQAKDTVRILKNTKQVAIEAVDMLHRRMPEFSIRETPLEAVRDALLKLPRRHAEVLEANLIDHDILRQALGLLQTPSLDHHRFGLLLTEHHQQLSEKKRVSTPKIDRMLDAALAAGALGGKINGSGGGGCMFAYAPERTEAEAEAIRAAGGVPYIIRIDEGSRFE